MVYKPCFYRIMRDEDPAYGVFRDPEEYQYYKNMFFNLTEIMAEVGFSEEVRTEIKKNKFEFLIKTVFE